MRNDTCDPFLSTWHPNPRTLSSQEHEQWFPIIPLDEISGQYYIEMILPTSILASSECGVSFGWLQKNILCGDILVSHCSPE